MNNTLFGKVQGLRASLATAHLEREVVIDGLLASLIAKQNAFLLGQPGTGKSDLVRDVCHAVRGARFFSSLLSPSTDPSELFGPVAITKLLNDEYIRDVQGYLPSAHVGFLDELFRGSSAVLNALLTLLNERTFHNGKQHEKTELQSIVAATNQWPSEESLQAFGDRFLFRPTIPSLQRPVSKATLDSWALGTTKRPVVGTHMDLEDLFELQEAAENIKVSETFQEKFQAVWDLLESRGITVSDRRRFQVVRFLKAWALVQGDDMLHEEHMHNSLEHCVYRMEEDKIAIRECLNQAVPAAAILFADAKRAADSVMIQFNSANSQGVRDLSSANAYVVKMRKFHNDLTVVKEKVEKILMGGSSRLTLEARNQGDTLLKKIGHYEENIIRCINNYSR